MLRCRRSPRVRPTFAPRINLGRADLFHTTDNKADPVFVLDCAVSLEIFCLRLQMVYFVHYNLTTTP